ncbi:hypothetical protein EWM64_g5811 [Hericium alpestre]|uniref:Uncharacterized protein n=1 Tax=Hericium alpestre TaxID=135208 RepID=A0A4Y9ZVX2_9AGAM|nr:hypothetical protein EWM64_g5811 [Hericium alpestre]
MKDKDPDDKVESLVAFRNRRCRELLAEESEAVRIRVINLQLNSGDGNAQVEGEQDDEAEGSGSRKEATPVDNARLKLEEHKKKIAALPLTMQVLVHKIQELTGWACTIMFGGPRPSDKGKIHFDSETEDKVTFQSSYHSYHEAIEKPYLEYLRKIYQGLALTTR